MPWSVRFVTEQNYVETQYAGVLTGEELRAAVHATLDAGKAAGTHDYLGDCTAMEGGHSVVDLYPLVDLLEASNTARTYREAIILPTLSAPAKDVAFWETAAKNRGFTIRLFTNREEALRWLLARTPSVPSSSGA